MARKVLCLKMSQNRTEFSKAEKAAQGIAGQGVRGEGSQLAAQEWDSLATGPRLGCLGMGDAIKLASGVAEPK
jgi:hypothetical protein